MTEPAEDDERPLPDVTDPELSPFWLGTTQGHLQVQRCGACGSHQWPPRPLCKTCHRDELGWVELSSRGRIYSWTTVHRTSQAWFRATTPYTVVIVALDDAPQLRMLGLLTGPGAPGFDLEVEAVFQEVAPGVHLPVWRISHRLGPGPRLAT